MSTISKVAELFLKSIPTSIVLKLGRRGTRIARHLPPNIQTQIDYYYEDFHINVDTKYPIEREMISGKYSPDLTSVLETVITQGDTCIDVGANIGALTLVMSKLTGDNGIVYAFEPNQLIFNRLLTNIELNKLSNITPVNLGLGDHNEKLGLFVSKSDPGNAGLTRGEIYDELVEVITLDTFFRGESIDRLDFMKVDVEGMEYSVFIGGKKTLKKYKPTILFETLKQKRERRLKEGSDIYDRMEEFLRGIGYLLFKINSIGAYKETTLKETSEDTLAIHKARYDLLKNLCV